MDSEIPVLVICVGILLLMAHVPAIPTPDWYLSQPTEEQAAAGPTDPRRLRLWLRVLLTTGVHNRLNGFRRGRSADHLAGDCLRFGTSHRRKPRSVPSLIKSSLRGIGLLGSSSERSSLPPLS